jgi:hypothetical protein
VIPQLKRKICVSGAQSADEVVFEGLDGTLGGIYSVIVGFNKLDGTITGCDKGLNGSCGLVIGDVEGWGMSFCSEDIKSGCEGIDDVVTLC